MEWTLGVVVPHSLGRKTDVTSRCLTELDYILDNEGAMNVMVRFFDHLRQGHGYEATHMKYDTFCETFPDTAKLLTIFVYS